MNVHKGWAFPWGIYSEFHSPITTPEIICVMTLTLQPIRGCPQHSGETGRRLLSAIHRRLLSQFFPEGQGTSVHKLQYYTPSIWLAADWARFPCNHRTLLPWCPWHKQALFNLLMDIHIMVNWQCQKKIHWPVSHDCIMGSSVHLTEVTCFLKVICWPLVVLVNSLLSYMISGAIISECFTIIVLKRPNISVPARKLCLKAKVAPTTHFWGPDISRKGQCTSISLICKREEAVGKLRKVTWSVPFYTQ